MKHHMIKTALPYMAAGAMLLNSAAAPVCADTDNHLTGQLGSFGAGGTDASAENGDDYDYNCALVVTADGIDEASSNTGRLEGGSADGSSAAGFELDDDTSGHTGILVNNAAYTISDTSISLLTDADGSDTCDFSGKGSAVAVFGEDADVTVENSEIHTKGVAVMPVFADSGSTVTIRESTLVSEGGTLNAEYMNTPDQGLMAAPPWILGIMGTSRCTNLMGNGTTMNVLDSDTSAGAWAVLSTDSGEDMTLNVYNSTLTLTNADESQYPLQAEDGQISETLDNPYTENYGSGYGSYVIGNAAETFAGSEINAGTYGAILTGGSALYTSIEEGQEYELKNSDGETTAVYTAEEDKQTSIHSDTFGFMAHQGTNSITLEKGTEVESGYATFLVKTGASNEQLTAAVDDTEITNGGVLIQVMDNDDATNGGMMAADSEENRNGGSQNFLQVHTEEAGFRTEEAQASASAQQFTFTNGTYEGNIYNASGSDGLEGSALYVTLGEGAVLSGGAASTSAIHVTYDGSLKIKENGGAAYTDEEEAAAFAGEYQNTSFDITEYFSIGQVANLIHDNAANPVYLTLTDDAVWNVTEESLLAGISISDEAKVIVPEGVTLTVGGVEYTDCTLTAEDEIAAGVPEVTVTEAGDDGPGQGGPGGNGGPGGGDGQTPPEMPGGNGGPGGGAGQTPPDKPDRVGGPGGMSEGDMANASAQVNTEGALTVSSGDVTAAEGSEALESTVTNDGETVTVTDAEIESGDYGSTGISVNHADVEITGTGITLGVDEDIAGTETAGSGIYNESGSVSVSDSVIDVSGAGRYSVAAVGDAELVVNDSVISAGGDRGADGHTAAVEDPFSNEGLLISGTSRASFSVGQSHTFYYNSLVTADGWAALSTDSATGSGLEFVAYNTEALALNGGYGLYADTNCRDYLYGSTLVSAEAGIIISNNGSVTIGSAGDAEDAVTEDGREILAELDGEKASGDKETTVIAGRNAVQVHSPDMMGEGNRDYSAQLAVSHATLATDGKIGEDGYEYTSEVNGQTYTVRAETDYEALYGEAVGAYIDYVDGAVILVKSTSADIALEDVTVTSSDGTALLTTLNSDSMSRYLKEDVGNGVNVSIRDSEISGSIVHDDYQRDLYISAEETTITGGVTYSDADAWNSTWEAYSGDDRCVWYDLDPETYITETHETVLELSGGSVWNVTEESQLTTLSVSPDSTVNGTIRAASEETLEDGTVVYTDAVVVTGTA